MKKEVWISTKNKELEKEARIMGAVLVGDKIFAPEIKIRDKKDEERAVKIARKVSHIIVECNNWKIIPMENLIAKLRGKTKIIAKVKNAEDAKIALRTLELGVDGIFLKVDDIQEFLKIQKMIIEQEGKQLTLEEAEITRIEKLGIGARACIDTADLMTNGEGALVGSSSQGMFLVQGEVEENSFVSPRPFRINAGAISLYIMVSPDKTKYLEEMKTGEPLLIVDRLGRTRTAFVCRSKIEVRPMLLVEAKKEGNIAKIVLQNAETVRLVTKDGSIAVTDIKGGEKVLVHFEKGGRHFGTLIKEEQIIEK
ncbi:MAG: 3-dehydroquinate synthase II [Candidatus Altiarchaeota archaeon]